MKVLIPPALHAYTAGQGEVRATGKTLADMFADLDGRFPGMRFRVVDEQDEIRGHIRVFVNGDAVRAMTTPLRATDEVLIVQALSGG